MSTASEKAYNEIRRRILCGDLPPNVQLTERELADICNVSRTPVREALRRLEAEMLVRRTSTQRCFISGWTSEKVEEISSLRALIESHAAKRAATHITSEQIDALRACNDEIGACISDSTVNCAERFAAANSRFHEIIIEAAQSERLVMMRRLLFDVPSSGPRRTDREQLLRSYADHEELIASFERRDADSAHVVMESHVRHAFFRWHLALRAKPEALAFGLPAMVGPVA